MSEQSHLLTPGQLDQANPFQKLDTKDLISACVEIDGNYSDPEETFRAMLEGSHPADQLTEAERAERDTLYGEVIRRAAGRLGFTLVQRSGEDSNG